MSDMRTLVLTIVGTGRGPRRAADRRHVRAHRRGVNARIDDLRTDLSSRMDRIEDRLEGMDGRLRNVEIAFGKVDQRLLTIERVVLPGPDADE